MKILADIGGTFCRFCVLDDQGRMTEPVVYKVQDYKDFKTAVQAFLRDAGFDAKGRSPELHLAVAACPKQDGKTWAFTNNNPWTIRENENNIRTILNDLEAAAHGLRSLDEVQNATAESHDLRFAVIGVGTGLGHAYLNYRARENLWHVTATHGGHVNAASGGSQDNEAILRAIAAARTTRQGPAIYEEVVSGLGLLNIYQAMRALKGLDCAYRNPQDFFTALPVDDDIFKNALSAFHQFLGFYIQAVCVISHAYDGVFLCGGVIDTLHQNNLLNLGEIMKHSATGVAAVQGALAASPLRVIDTATYPNIALEGLKNWISMNSCQTPISPSMTDHPLTSGPL